MELTKVRLQIAGSNYVISTTDSESYVHELAERLDKDMKDIFMWQIKEGPGTLWETNGINASSRCHGFSSHAGVHLLRDVVGFEEINKDVGYIKISPHICSLEWARGFVDIDGYKATVEWKLEGDTFCLDVDLPRNYRYAVTLPHEVRHGKVKSIVTRINGEIR